LEQQIFDLQDIQPSATVQEMTATEYLTKIQDAVTEIKNKTDIDTNEFWNYVYEYCTGNGSEGTALLRFVNEWGNNRYFDGLLNSVSIPNDQEMWEIAKNEAGTCQPSYSRDIYLDVQTPKELGEVVRAILKDLHGL
jgi:hypothetical protein